MGNRMSISIENIKKLRSGNKIKAGVDTFTPPQESASQRSTNPLQVSAPTSIGDIHGTEGRNLFPLLFLGVPLYFPEETEFSVPSLDIPLTKPVLDGQPITPINFNLSGGEVDIKRLGYSLPISKAALSSMTDETLQKIVNNIAYKTLISLIDYMYSEALKRSKNIGEMGLTYVDLLQAQKGVLGEAVYVLHREDFLDAKAIETNKSYLITNDSWEIGTTPDYKLALKTDDESFKKRVLYGNFENGSVSIYGGGIQIQLDNYSLQSKGDVELVIQLICDVQFPDQKYLNSFTLPGVKPLFTKDPSTAYVTMYSTLVSFEAEAENYDSVQWFYVVDGGDPVPTGDGTLSLTINIQEIPGTTRYVYVELTSANGTVRSSKAYLR